MPTTLPPRELSLGRILLFRLRLRVVVWRYVLVGWLAPRLATPLVQYRCLRYPVRWLVNLSLRMLPRR
jgi:hypothetical protein